MGKVVGNYFQVVRRSSVLDRTKVGNGPVRTDDERSTCLVDDWYDERWP